MTVLVTGGTGFLGRDLVAGLVRCGCKVRVLSRRPVSIPGAEVVRGDITDKKSLLQAMRGCDVVFHLAALVAYNVPQEELDRVNVQGTRNVIEAAIKAGVKRIVYASSVAAGGEGTTLYSKSKQKAEALAVSFSKKIPIIILRPAPIYGKGRSYVNALVVSARVGVLFRLGLKSKTHLVAKKKVVEAFLLARNHGKSGVPYVIADKEPVNLKELYQVVREEFHVNEIVIPLAVAYPFLYSAALFFEGVSKFSGKKPVLSRPLLRVIVKSRKYDTTPAQRDLGYRPIDTRAGFRQAVREAAGLF